MVLPVSDFASNAPEQLEHYAKLLSRSEMKRRLFEEIYRGKRSIKTVAMLASALDVTSKRILELAKPLAEHHLFAAIKHEGRIAYRKNPLIAANKRRISALARDKRKLDALPTKRKISAPRRMTIQNVTGVRPPRMVTIDDIQEFGAVKKIKRVPDALSPARLPEATVKKGFAARLGNVKAPKDWGGEQHDLFSTNATVGGRRRSVAIAFKGPGTSGPLTPKKMGKRGDQIQRLVETASADIFLIQYEGEIDSRVLDQLRSLAIAKSVLSGSQTMYGIIDRRDTYRLRLAYPEAFKA
jgi:hypothetical protein